VLVLPIEFSGIALRETNVVSPRVVVEVDRDSVDFVHWTERPVAGGDRSGTVRPARVGSTQTLVSWLPTNTDPVGLSERKRNKHKVKLVLIGTVQRSIRRY
jgi:hypothetical protein